MSDRRKKVWKLLFGGGGLIAALAAGSQIWSPFPSKAPTPAPAPVMVMTGNATQGAAVQINGNNNVVAPQLPAVATSPLAVPPVADHPDAKIASLATGMSRAYLEKLFGPPREEEPDGELGVSNLLYAFPDFFLQVIVDQKQVVVFYSITTRVQDFRPEIPYMKGVLLAGAYASYGDADPVYSDATSKYYEYAEQHYLGNAGNYHSIYLGYCPAGVLLPHVEGRGFPMLDDTPAALTEFRSSAAPNCYGVGAIMGDEVELIKRERMGFDYYAARDIP